MEAKGHLYIYVLAEKEEIAKPIEPQYVEAFRKFENDRANFEEKLHVNHFWELKD